MSGERLTGLDGLRGVAAVGVMVMHAHLAALPVPHGYLAVDLFYLLSGYVIARSYEPALRQGMGLGAYLLIRLERLYPMLLLGGLLGLAVYAAGWSEFRPRDQTDFALAVIGQFLLIPLLASGTAFSFNGAQWSIVHELIANAAHAALLPRLSNRVLAAIAGLSALGLAATARHFGNLNTGFTPESFVWALSRVGFGFFLGVLLHRTEAVWRPKVPRLSFWVPAALLLAALDVPDEWAMPGTACLVLEMIVVVGLFPMVVMLGVEARAGKVAEELGALSYPLYAIHFPVMIGLKNAHAPAWSFAAAAVLLLGAAWVLGRRIDEPLNRWRRQARRERLALRAA